MTSDTAQAQLLSSKDAGKMLGYTHDYISKLCREGKIPGVQKGRIWYVTQGDLEDFQARHEAELQAKKTQLSEKFSAIRQLHDTQRSESDLGEGTNVSYASTRASADPYRQEAKAEEQVPTYQERPQQQKISFAIPKEFVAAGVLSLLLLVPYFSHLSAQQKRAVVAQPTVTQTASVVSSRFAGSLTENLSDGIASVIAAQATLVTQTANTFSFVQYLSDGYWQLATNATELSMNFYRGLERVSNVYLGLYLFQGETIVYSVGEINKIGANVLAGYELVGKSVVIGTQNTISSYKAMLNLGSATEEVKKN